MSNIMLVEYQRIKDAIGLVHCDPGGGRTSCGYSTMGPKWVELGHGSLYDVDCQRCKAALRAAGDIS